MEDTPSLVLALNTKKWTPVMRGVTLLVSVVLLMFVFALFVMPPFYDAFCRLTGLNGKVTQSKTEPAQLQPAQPQDAKQIQIAQKNDSPSVAITQPISVQFITDIDKNIDWQFEPVVRSMEAVRGEKYTAHFKVTNNTDQDMVGRAIPSVTPSALAQYLNKIECFCFQAQPLKAHETKQMTLVFYLDQKMPKEYEAITLAYKLYLAKEKTSL